MAVFGKATPQDTPVATEQRKPSCKVLAWKMGERHLFRGFLFGFVFALLSFESCSVAQAGVQQCNFGSLQPLPPGSPAQLIFVF